MSSGFYDIEIDSVTEPEWSALLEQCADANIYQTWAYGAARWGRRNLSHLVLRRNGSIVAAAQLRVLLASRLHAGIAYLRWGPLCKIDADDAPDVVDGVATALYSEYAVKRGLYLEILPRAFAGSPRAELFRSNFRHFTETTGVFGEHYRTFVLDLSSSLDQLRRNLDKKWRNQLNAAERNQLTVSLGSDSETYRSFCRLYAQMQQRKHFQTNVDVEEFGRIQDQLPDGQKMKVLICKQGDEPLAGLIASALGDSAIYLLGATSDAAMKLKAAYQLQWMLIRYLKEQGIRYYDLGGTDPVANPGVHHFKSGLGGLEMEHIGAFTASGSELSTVAVWAGQLLRSRLHHMRGRFAGSNSRA